MKLYNRFKIIKERGRIVENLNEVNETQNDQVERGGCLTTYLVFMCIVNTLTSISYIFSGDMIKDKLNISSGWILPLLSIFCISNIIFAIGIWKWKRWGVYGIGITSFIAFFINISIGISIFSSLLGLVGLIIIIVLVKPLWKYMN